MESIVRDALSAHLNNNNLITSAQHGFLANHSTGAQLLECLNDWSIAVEEGECVDVCYIDFARAFDSVSLPKLIQKLSSYGISGLCLNWLKSFLFNRTLCVKVNKACSNSAVQISGVPQGSVLGPLCFILYINDLPNVVQHCKLKLYADDVKVYTTFKPSLLVNDLQRDLDAISAWARSWQLCISVAKTFVLHIGAKNPHRVYSINDTPIASADSIKDLGVNIVSDLSWSKHVSEVVKKANRTCNVILHGFANHNIELYMSAFNSYVKPILNYCCYVYNPVLCRDIDLIENVLRAYTRRAFRKCRLPYMCYTDRLAKLNMLSVERTRFIACLTMFFNVYNGFTSCDVLNTSTYSPHVLHNLRGHSKKLFIPFCKSSIRNNYFTVKFARLWNILPTNVVSTNITKAFTNRVKQADLSKLYQFRF
jgi:ribonuclease P/MRP protein subunit RPP40